MTQTEDKSTNIEYSEDIISLQNVVANNPEDIMSKLTLAIAYEQEKHYQDAYSVYQEILEQDEEQVLTDTAKQAIESLQEQNLITTTEVSTDEIVVDGQQEVVKKEFRSQKQTSFLYRLASLSIGTKQFLALVLTSAFSIFIVALAGDITSRSLGEEKLTEQSVTELAVTVNNYQARINETESGFRGQATNTAIIEAAKIYRATGDLPDDLSLTVKEILLDEILFRQIEYATLIGLDSKVISSANQNRFAEIFNPNDLSAEVLKFPRRFKTNAIVSAEEINAEKPPFYERIKDQDVLMNFSFTPVADPQTKEIIAILIGGEIVDTKTLFLKSTFTSIGIGYGAIYTYQDGEFKLVTSGIQKTEDGEFESGVPLPDLTLLEEAQKGVGGKLTQRVTIEGEEYTVAVQALPNYQGDEIAFIVRGTPETELETLITQSRNNQILFAILALIFAAGVAYVVGKALANPILKLQQTAKKLGTDEQDVRAEVNSDDEVGQLAQTFNEMVERIDDYTQEIQTIANEQEAEAKLQKQQREELQKNVINLLLEIEGASRGDLTIQAGVVAGEVGSIADAFNTTLRGLQRLVRQVIDSASQVHQTALDNGQLVNNLATNSAKQDQSIQTVGVSIEEIAQSSEKISESAQNASTIARESRLTAQEGEKLIDNTVDSIYEIRHTVADTAKKAKRLADSSQEISKIVNIISNISEKTNLLAFNASIEAARAGENGQGFRVVADEVRRLAEQVTFSTQEIEQLVVTIQEETSEMMSMMEESTTQVVNGTKLVKSTKDNLQRLAQISNQIDTLLESITQSTVQQKLISQKVNEEMQEVAVVTKETATESNSVSQSLQELVTVAMDMQKSASSFQVE